jgi:hypothetical protein
MSKSSYAIVVWCSVLLLGLFAGPRNPYGADFFSILVPALLLLVSLQWLLLSSRFGWQIAAMCTAFVGAVTILSSRLPWARENPANYVLLMLIAIVAQLVTLWFLVPEKAARSILLAENLAVALVILSVCPPIDNSDSPRPESRSKQEFPI